MIGIVIKAEDKINNPHMSLSDVGEIQLFNRFPDFWNGWSNYKRLTDQHQNDGWFPVVEPTIGIYEYLGDVYFDDQNKVFTYNVETFSPEEQSEIDQNILDNDADAQLEDQQELDGRELYRRIKNKIRRMRTNGILTTNQFKNIRKTLNPALYPLNWGDWDIVQDLLNEITIPGNAPAIYTTIYNAVKTEVDDYVSNVYNRESNQNK